MKTKSILFGLLALALAGLFIVTNKAPAQSNPHQTSAEVIMFRLTENVNPNYPVGIFPYVITASKGAPQLIPWPNPEAKTAAQIIADCLDLGYEITFNSQIGITLVKSPSR